MKTNISMKRLGALVLAGSISTFSARAADTTDTTPAPAAAPAAPATPASDASTGSPAAAGTTASEPAKPAGKHHRKHHRAEASAKKSDAATKEGKAWFGGVVENSRLHASSAHHDAPDIQLTKVFRNSPAYAAGLRAGDVIWKFDGERLTKTTQFQRELSEQKPGNTVSIEVYRHGKKEEMKVKLGSAPVATASQPTPGAKIHS